MLKTFVSLLLCIVLCPGFGAAAPPSPAPDKPPSSQAPAASAASAGNPQRVRDLVRAGSLYLGLQDALALAIENNLDVELERSAVPQGDTELERAQGGGTNRGLTYTLQEAPVGVGGPLSPLVVAPASSNGPNGTSVPTNALELGVLGEPVDNYSVQGSVAQSSGTSVPTYDPSVFGQLNWLHQSTLETNPGAYGTSNLVQQGFVANTGVQQGFSTGLQAAFNFDNLHQSTNATNNAYNPISASSLGFTITQPLLRGFGRALNRRFIRIAGNERKISSLLFQQQLILTVYGVIRLYTDFVALYEDVNVKEETLRSASKLLADTQVQVDEGTLAPVELTRAKAQVFSTEQDLINSRGLLEEQEIILKSVVTRDAGAGLRGIRIVPTDTLAIPDKDEVRPLQDQVAEAIAHRPDLGQARLQVENSRIGLEGSRNATKPEVDLVGTMQNNGLAGAATGYLAGTNLPLAGGYGTALGQALARDYPTYGIGLQVTLPIHNRVAEADLARDELQVMQSQIRVQQLQNQASLEVEDALIAMRRARASYEAAMQARKFQQESLEAEQTRFEVGASTAFFVIQYESLLAQARSTEVAAKSSYVKARAALDRATGSILEAHNISIDAALKGQAR